MSDQLMGLLNSEADVSYRGGLLPLLRRVLPDIGGDDISEFEGPLELATPALAYDPVRNMALTGAMLRGHIPVDEGLLTQTMLDAPLMGGLLAGATGAVPRGAVLGANVLPSRFLDDVRPARENIRISSSFSRDQDAIGVVPNQMDDYANVTTNMTPSRYLNLAKPIDKLTESDKETIKYFEKVFREQGDKTVANPWLDITWDKSAGKWDVTGHEGRHRMIAAKNVFGPDAEIPVQLFPKQEGKGKIPIKALNDLREMSFYGLDQDTATKMKTALGQRFGMERLPFILGASKGPTAALPGLLSDAAQGRIRNSRVRDRLSDDQQAAIVQAANTAHEDRLDLARSVQQFDDKFDLDQMLVDNDLAVESDGFVQAGHVFLNDIDIPAGAKEGDILPISAVKKGARFVFPDGSEKDFSPNPGGPFRSDDLGVELINLDEDGFADIVLRDWNAVESRILADTVAEDAVTTLEDALGHSDHHARAAAFRKILDELGIEYNKAGIEGVNSEYVYVPTKWDVDGDAVEDLLKIRFADHTRQSGLHEPADYNIADGGYDDAISALDDIVQKISGVRTEMFSNPVTAALPGLLEQQYMEDSERLLRDSQGLLGATQRRQNQLNALQQFYASGGV